MFTIKKNFALMLCHVLSVVTPIVNRARTHALSIAACMITCMEGDNCAVNTSQKKECIFVVRDDALRNC